MNMAEARVSPARPITILLVDDERVVADIYSLVLGRAGYNVVVANNGPAALTLAKAEVPDLIFLDIRMPGMSGIEVLDQLRDDALTRETRVVMLTNYDDPALVERSQFLGAKEYVVKAGTDPHALVQIVSRLVGQPAP